MKKYLFLVLISFTFLSCKKETEEDLVMPYNYAINNTCPELECLDIWPGTTYIGGGCIGSVVSEGCYYLRVMNNLKNAEIQLYTNEGYVPYLILENNNVTYLYPKGIPSQAKFRYKVDEDIDIIKFDLHQFVEGGWGVWDSDGNPMDGHIYNLHLDEGHDIIDGYYYGTYYYPEVSCIPNEY